MKLRMAENSLFAVLLRAPWWVSFAVAGAIFASLRMAVPDLYAAFFALPFIAIGLYASWLALRAPSAASVDKALKAAAAMTWEEFRGHVEEAYRRKGYTVSRSAAEGADLELEKAGRTALVACKRWRVARTGAEPLRQLHDLGMKRQAQDCVYLCAGELTEQARAFAAEKKMHVVTGRDLARLLKT
jgi:restriction system protein